MRIKKLQEYYSSPEYIEKLNRRFKIFKKCVDDPMEINKYVLESWSIDPIAFIEQFGWIINPKFNNEIKPFFLFEYQKNIITRMWECELSGEEHNLLIDKPREMGLTWVVIWYLIWRWLFTKNWSGFVLSRTETEVDDGTSDPSSSLFGKLRWSLSYLPSWIMPEGFEPKGKKGNSTDMGLRLANPSMMSSIVGSTANQNAARGRRYSFVFLDECFFIENFLSVNRSLAQVANTRVYVSTSKTGRTFQKFVALADERGDHIQLSWKDNPFKDQEWYNEKLKDAEVDPEALKEIEVGYSVPESSQYYPEISLAKVEPVEYDPNIPLFVALDYGRQDHTVLIWGQFTGGGVNIIECLAKNKVDFDWFVPFMNKEAIYNAEKYFGTHKELLEKIRKWKKPLAYFGEPAHKQVHYPSNTSIQKELFKYGIRLVVNDHAIKHEVRRKAGSTLLPKITFNESSDGVMNLYDAIQNSRYAGSAKSISKDAMMKPAHDDETGDFRSAFENLCVNIGRMARTQRTDITPDMKQNNFIGSLIKYLRV